MMKRVWSGTTGWLDLRGRGLGMAAFILNRITGLALVAYLLLHFVVLSLLAAGEAAWGLFIALAKTPLFLAFDVVLIAGLLIHGLNGIRLGITGLGYGIRIQKGMFIVLMLAAAGLTAYVAFRLFAGGA